MARVAPSERFRRELDEALEAVDEHVDPIKTVGRLGAWLILQQALRTAGSWAGHGMSAAKSPWRVQRHLLQPHIGHPGAELGRHRVIKARVVQRQPQQVLPVDPGPDRLSRLPVGQLLRPLQDRHQRQPRRRPARTAPDPERGRELLIGQPLAQPVPDLNRQRPRALTGYLAAIAAAICGSGSGQATACTHMTYPILRPGRGEGTTAGQIMTATTTQTRQVGRRVVN